MTRDEGRHAVGAAEVKRAGDRVHIKHAIMLAERDHQRLLAWLLRRYLEKKL